MSSYITLSLLKYYPDTDAHIENNQQVSSWTQFMCNMIFPMENDTMYLS